VLSDGSPNVPIVDIRPASSIIEASLADIHFKVIAISRALFKHLMNLVCDPSVSATSPHLLIVARSRFGISMFVRCRIATLAAFRISDAAARSRMARQCPSVRSLERRRPPSMLRRQNLVTQFTNPGCVGFFLAHLDIPEALPTTSECEEIVPITTTSLCPFSKSYPGRHR
jgi:hypothetical protein